MEFLGPVPDERRLRAQEAYLYTQAIFPAFICFSNLKVFRGNRDGNSVMKHYLKEKLVAKTLRILRHQNSKDFMGSTVCLRAEVYGCEFQTGKCVLSRDV